MLYDDLNRFAVRALFWEMSTPDTRAKLPPLFTLKMEAAHGLPSAYQVYMDSVDEYDAAMKIAGNMKNWRKLCNCAWFMDGSVEVSHEGLKQWREDMEARDKSKAKAQLLEKALEGSVQAVTKIYGIEGKKPKKTAKKASQKPAGTSRVVDIAKGIK